jgi:hypothetical protein
MVFYFCVPRSVDDRRSHHNLYGYNLIDCILSNNYPDQKGHTRCALRRNMLYARVQWWCCDDRVTTSPNNAENTQFRRRGHSMPPRSRFCDFSGKFFFRQQKNKILFYFIKKIIFFIKIKKYFYFFLFETKNFSLRIIFISMNWYHRAPILGSICDYRPRR